MSPLSVGCTICLLSAACFTVRHLYLANDSPSHQPHLCPVHFVPQGSCFQRGQFRKRAAWYDFVFLLIALVTWVLSQVRGRGDRLCAYGTLDLKGAIFATCLFITLLEGCRRASDSLFLALIILGSSWQPYSVITCPDYFTARASPLKR